MIRDVRENFFRKYGMYGIVSIIIIFIALIIFIIALNSKGVGSIFLLGIAVYLLLMGISFLFKLKKYLEK